MRSFYSEGPLSSQLEQARLRDVHHACVVLRLAKGTTLQLVDGAGGCAEAVLEDPETGLCRITSFRTQQLPPLTVYVPILKGERQDWLVEKLCELGVSDLVPLVCERAQIRELSPNKLQRWQRIAAAATEQSRRTQTMQIHPASALSALAADELIVLHPYRGETSKHAPRSANEPARCKLVIGPEGGFSDSEVLALSEHGARFQTLPTPILRAETAAIVAVAVYVSERYKTGP